MKLTIFLVDWHFKRYTSVFSRRQFDFAGNKTTTKKTQKKHQKQPKKSPCSMNNIYMKRT